MFRLTWDTRRLTQIFAYRTLTLSRHPFQNVPLIFVISSPGPATPWCKHHGLGSSAFARHYLQNLILISTPSGTEMFHFPEYRLDNLFIQLPIMPHYQHWVAPFGILRINACLPLPEVYRCLPRPSSPIRTKASVMCP